MIPQEILLEVFQFFDGLTITISSLICLKWKIIIDQNRKHLQPSPYSISIDVQNDLNKCLIFKYIHNCVESTKSVNLENLLLYSCNFEKIVLRDYSKSLGVLEHFEKLNKERSLNFAIDSLKVYLTNNFLFRDSRMNMFRCISGFAKTFLKVKDMHILCQASESLGNLNPRWKVGFVLPNSLLKCLMVPTETRLEVSYFKVLNEVEWEQLLELCFGKHSYKFICGDLKIKCRPGYVANLFLNKLCEKFYTSNHPMKYFRCMKLKITKSIWEEFRQLKQNDSALEIEIKNKHGWKLKISQDQQTFCSWLKIIVEEPQQKRIGFKKLFIFC